MSDMAFNDGWTVQRLPDGPATPVFLPHDAMLGEGRAAHSPAGSHQGFFLGGQYRYRKPWYVPLDMSEKRVKLFFEGVYRHSRVLVNGHDLGGATNGYTEFEVPIHEALRFGEENLIEVTADNSALPNARWYTGAGIYRPVWLRVENAVSIPRDGLRVRTLSVCGGARLAIELDILNPGSEALDATVIVVAGGLECARESQRIAGTAGKFEVSLPAPKLWSADTPNLYRCVAHVSANGTVLAKRSTNFGIRTITVDGRSGLRINGQEVLLRGGNIHSDSGVLGAATFAAAEYRRVRIMKEAGFNAIRVGHAPCSRALLDACDALGMYVIDELYDGWYDHKTEQDDALHFSAAWETDADAMIAKDRNHPSVIMYAIGNENSEPDTAYGIATARRLAEHFRMKDRDRLVTAGVNLMSAALGWPKTRKGSETEQPASKGSPNMNSTMINAITNQFGWLMRVAPRLKRTDAVTIPIFELLDVAGYNYGYVRYKTDTRLHPERVIVGTETVPGVLPEVWALVESLPGVIGDFVWAGWDYLGEAGIGCWEYDTRKSRLLKPYPRLTAGVGLIDLIGHIDTAGLLARMIWGQLTGSVIAVRPVHLAPHSFRKTAWRSSDAVVSWSWRGCEGKPAYFEVLSADDEVELLINGRSLGRQRAGKAQRYVAKFKDVYAPGEVLAIGYRNGIATQRTTIRSAGRVSLRLNLENETISADGQDLAFVQIILADADANVEMLDDDNVRIAIDGPATLAGFGSATTITEESFVDNVHSTYRGRALAVIRSGLTPSRVTVMATSERHGSASVEIYIVD
ncbi:beta-galactosidase [Acidocella aquatica]|uniref:Beta-galactosidase n=1 Tax=Acidocella aquatica TaxID=1922313 RepID=A0ABQ6ADF9_9PROT|nr:glycoside hydrolase family 2 TIM barrel-domain containing protein [Acidocella aquatica]GLR68075.1 beta-galactosidase [Acidocella aquatica]